MTTSMKIRGDAPSRTLISVGERWRPDAEAIPRFNGRPRAGPTRPEPGGHESTPPPGLPRAYGEEASLYDTRTAAYQAFRRTIVKALPVGRGDVVLDVGCGTGLCFGFLLEKVGPDGAVIGIDESPEMAAVARERVAHEGWHNVTVVESRLPDAQIPATADGALFCAVHDVMRSPKALRKVLENLRPGAWVTAGGGKWAPPWMVPLNMQVLALHAPYVRSFEGFSRPWSHLEHLLEDVFVHELAFGSGYVATGRVPCPTKRFAAVSTPRGHAEWGASTRPMRLEAAWSTDRHASSSTLANTSGALIHTP